MSGILLFSERTTDGTSQAFTVDSSRGAVAVSGTFDGATVALEASIDGGTTFISCTEVTEAAIKAFQATRGTKIRATISSAGASTSLTVNLQPEL